MYINKLGGFKACGTSTVTEELLTSAATIQRYVVSDQCLIDQVGIVITTATSSSGNVVVDFKSAAYPGGSASTFATLTIPTGVAAGGIYYKRFSPVGLAVGSEVSVVVRTAATSTGKGVSFFSLQDDPETSANNANMVASA